MIKWIIRNFTFLISGLILLPLALYALLMFSAFAKGFMVEESLLATGIMWMIGLFPVVFVLSVKLALRSFNKVGDYAYWDFLPIGYFFLVFIFLFWGKF